MRIWGAALVLAVALGGPAAHAQMDSREGIQLQNQILELRRDIQNLRQNQGQNQGGAPPPRQSRQSSNDDNASGLIAPLLDRVSTLEDQVRDLRGQVDRLTNQQQRQAEDFNKQLADMNFALQSGGGAPARGPGPGALAPPALAAPPIAASPPIPAPRTPEIAMQEGSAALARRDYATAENAAREVIAKKGARQADGQFLLAQAEMGQRKYQQAAPDFYDAYNRQRTGPHAPDALLGVANALIGVGDKTSACEALTKLRTEFPQPRPDLREGELSARQRASCR